MYYVSAAEAVNILNGGLCYGQHGIWFDGFYTPSIFPTNHFASGEGIPLLTK